MTESAEPLALVPLSNATGSPSTFSQQGTIDWTALGRMQLSASVAIVGRLAAAGIESLTVAVGQILCNRVPIGAHGEKVLMESMGKLKSFSAFGDVVWFGIGIRHVLRSLVHTSQGASCVALCAALAECHSRKASALVLYEMAKRSGSPQELSPSVSQWEAMIKTCASIFTPSTFGIRVQQLLRLGGYNITLSEASDPRDIADALFAVGSVATGEIASVKISGVASCVWVAAYADYVLGMRVHMESDTGSVLWMNYSEPKGSAQVIVTVGVSEPQGTAVATSQSISRTVFVKGGQTFICQMLGLPDDHAPFFIGGRTHWGSVLVELMGEEASVFRSSKEDSRCSRNPEDSGHRENQPLHKRDILECLAEMIVATACYALRSSPLYTSRADFYESFITNVPEFRHLKRMLETTENRLLDKLDDDRTVLQIYVLAEYQLGIHCRCPEHALFSRCQVCPVREHCLTRYAQYFILLANLRRRLVMETPFHPSVAGLRLLFRMFQPYKSSMKAHFGIPGHLKNTVWIDGLRRAKKVALEQPSLLEWISDPESINLQRVIACFSGHEPKTWEKKDEISARSDGKIYCYIHTLREVSEQVETMYQIHVGAGSIYSNHRPYTVILDKDHSAKTNMKYNWPSVEECTGFSSLWQDTSSHLTLRAFAEESDQLRFWYTIFGNGRDISFSPGQFFKNICKATQWRGYYLANHKIMDSISLPPYTYEQTCLIVCGEGRLQPGLDSENIVLRPHQGNTLGKCVVLTLMDGRISLLRSKDDLEAVLKIQHSIRPSGGARSILLS